MQIAPKTPLRPAPWGGRGWRGTGRGGEILRLPWILVDLLARRWGGGGCNKGCCCIRTHTYMHTYRYTYTYKHTHTYMEIHTHVQTHTRTDIWKYAHTYKNTHIRIPIHIKTHTLLHSYIFLFKIYIFVIIMPFSVCIRENGTFKGKT